MSEPKVRFMRDNGNSYPAWEKHTIGDMTVELTEYRPLSCGLPLLTSARTGLMFQDEYRGKSSTENEDTLFSVVPRGAVTYRHMSDDNIFHFNINGLVDAGLVSKEYPVFSTVNGNNISLLVEYLNSSKSFLEFCKAQKKGGTRTRLYFKALKNFEMMIPCPEEQQKIADFLSSVDEVITASEQEVANLETQKKAVMKKIFSQEVRFKRADGSDFPEWGKKKLGDVCSKIGSGKTPKGGSEIYTQNGVLFIRSQNVINAMLDLTDKTCIPKSVHDGMRNTELQYLDVLLNITGASIGRCCLFDLHEIANVNQHVCIIRLKDKESYVPKYVEQIMLSDYIQNQIGSCQNGGSREGLNFEQIGNFSFLSPCLEEQRLIADFLSDFDEAIAAAKKELELWKELKKGLLQQMFV